MKTPLYHLIRDKECKKCPLYKTAQSVCLIGEGKYPTDKMIIGEAPGFREDSIGRPFSGKSGREILDPALKYFNINREDIFITNVVHCRPPGNRTPEKEEIESCREFLEEEIDYVNPSKILLLGKVAMGSLLMEDSFLKDSHGKETFKSISEARKGCYTLKRHGGNILVNVTYHPAYILRNPEFKDDFMQDLRSFFGDTDKTDTWVKRWNIKEFLTNYKGDISIDVETDALKSKNKKDLIDLHQKIISISVSPKKGEGFPLNMDDRSDWESLHSIIRKECLLIGHNLKFDLKCLIREKYMDKNILYEEKIFDTLLAFNIIDENYPHKDLKSLSYNFTSMVKYEQPTAEEAEDPWKVYAYNCRDVDATKRLYNYISKILEENPSLKIPLKIDCRTMAVLADMEMRGNKIDRDALNEVERRLIKELEKIAKKIPVENINSSQQISKMLLKRGFNLPKTQGGRGENYSCDQHVLKSLLTQGSKNKNISLVELLLQHRKYQKLNSTFVQGIKKRLMGDYVYPTYYIAKREDFEEEGGTVTGRLSSKNPNLQQTPRDKESLDPKINPRRFFIPSQKDYSILALDYSQIEMVIAGIYYKEPKLIDMIVSGGDIHEKTASEVFEVKKPSIDQRKAAKAVNFGIIYGISPWGLSKRLGWKEDEAKRFIDKYFSKFPDLRHNIGKLKTFIVREGYVESYFKRKRRLPGADFSSIDGRRKLRQGTNFPIQGTAADLTKILMWEIFKEKKRELGIIGNVHDELVIETHDLKVKKYVGELGEIASNLPLKDYGVDPFPIKLKGEIEVGKNWLELKDKYVF